ncbi:hypothetical protein ACH42_02085 [Endozoicomonas sp. (ex Bugula neritina AB1)]|nr:hypothetical protein ACH42_02085 [Endozoicomonas sp. (ex Bugula neritina AB1)]
MPFLSQIVGHSAERIAIIDSDGEHSFGSLVSEAQLLAGTLRRVIPTAITDRSKRPRIAFLAGRHASSASVLLAIWLSDAIAVPLDPLMSLPEWQWRLEELGVNVLLYAPLYRAEAQYIAQCTHITLVSTEQGYIEETPLRLATPEQSALILFSRYEESRPIPVVHSFQSLAAQMQTLIQAWQWRPEDRLLHVLPLSNFHGLINGLLASMATGSCCEMLDNFKIHLIWDRLSSGKVSLFTAVPTIYQYLVDAWNKASADQQKCWKSGLSHVRQTLVGPAPVTTSTCKQWFQISNIHLHFCFGTTETGMIFHNDAHGREMSGKPMPGVNLRLTDEQGREVTEGHGELEVRTPQLFKEYFDNEALTQCSYNNGWFRTRGLALKQGDMYRMLGHRNLDVINTGGYRVSALEIEKVIEQHPEIRECAVLGTPCERWGEAICIFIVPESNPVALPKLREWLCPKLATYKFPTQLTVLQQMPRTSTGTIDKQSLKRELTSRILPPPV